MGLTDFRPLLIPEQPLQWNKLAPYNTPVTYQQDNNNHVF